MTLISIEADVRRCKRGHEVSGHNAQQVRHTSGRYYTACRQCRNDAVKRVKQRQRGEPIALLAPKPVRRKDEPRFATRELWKALPYDLRARVAGIVMDDDPPDPLVAAVIRRAARKRVYDGLGIHFATIALVEALVDEVREARSDRLRIDRVLRALLGGC